MTNEDEDDVEILSSEDEKIKLIGEIFSNDSSRKILRLLTNEEMTANEIAQKNNMSLALVTHHLKRMQKARMVKISKTEKSVKGQDMKYYAATKQSFLIVPPEKTVQTILNSFKKFSKFAAIGLAGLVSWMIVKPDGGNLQVMPIHQPGQYKLSEDTTPDADITLSESERSSSDENTWSSGSEIPAAKVEEESYSDMDAEPESAPSHSGVEEFNLQVGDSADIPANTGAVSLDKTVYPVPWSSTGAEAIDPFIFSIIIPVVVIMAGVILERVLTRWLNKRKTK